ncbi:MAG: CAP domain-containing protein [Spirochaetales bacterium]|nr:CAP domain-containing protein [Spirochaetales bacterium]MCF7937023.1 CAP domain-containing protein [Spirochaetales bacterium]
MNLFSSNHNSNRGFRKAGMAGSAAILLATALFLGSCSTWLDERSANRADASQTTPASNNARQQSLGEGEMSLSAGEKAPLLDPQPELETLLDQTGVNRETFQYYRKLSKNEDRLRTYQDSDQMLVLKLAQLETINQSRRNAGLDPLGFDILSSRVANKFGREAALKGYTGHWNTSGQKPYQRYAAAGGSHHISENASGTSSSADLSRRAESYLELMQKAHRRFMNETAPNDGHKQNVLDPLHTHVGIGIALEGGEFRYYEEYVDRYLTYHAPSKEERPLRVKSGETRTIAFSPGIPPQLPPAENKEASRGRPPLFVYAVLVYYEPPIKELSPSQIERRGSYQDYSDVITLQIWPWDLEAFTESTEQEDPAVYKIPLYFPKAGSYYVQVYLSPVPYKAGAEASTAGKIQASGLVIFAE